MPKDLLLICSKGFPGSFKVITNLKGVLRGIALANIVPIENLFLLRQPTGSRRLAGYLEIINTRLGLLDQKTVENYGDSILLAGWGYPYEVLLRKLNKKGITPSLIMCSTPGQSELSSHELIWYNNIIEYVRKGKIKHWLLNRRLFNSIGQVIKKSIYFPHTIDLTQFDNVIPQELEGKNMDLFCPTRAGKNILNQVIGFKISEVQATLHINFSSHLLNQFINNINAKISHHDWIDDSEYYNFISGMDLSLQATFTESFSYAVAERMCLGIPVITSRDIYLTSDDDFLSRYLCVDKLDTPSEIARHIKIVFADSKLHQSLGMRCRTVIREIASRNNSKARHFISDFLR